MNKLERLIFEEITKSFEDLNIEQHNRINLVNYLKRIGNKDINILEHSIRVGKLGVEVAKLLNINPNKLFYPGLLHDVGKIRIDDEVIKRSNGYNTFTTEDMKAIMPHPLHSYEILKNDYRYSAEISLWHHRHQNNKYPKEEDFPPEMLNLPIYKQKEIEKISKFISVIDCYDAAKNRDNGRFWKKKPTPKEVEEIMFKEKNDSANLIENLYRNGIFE
jgi:HD-GYP domain-containing protein (c-di-GMP phosphodiesterase class II)